MALRHEGQQVSVVGLCVSGGNSGDVVFFGCVEKEGLSMFTRCAAVLTAGTALILIAGSALSQSALGADSQKFIGSLSLGYTFFMKHDIILVPDLNSNGGNSGNFEADRTFKDITSKAGLSFAGSFGYKFTKDVYTSLDVRYLEAAAKIDITKKTVSNQQNLGDPKDMSANFTKLDIGLVPVTLNVGYDHMMKAGGSGVELSARAGIGANFIASLSANEADTNKNKEGQPLYKEGRAVKKGSTFSGLSAQAVLSAAYAFSPAASVGVSYTFGYDKVKLKLKDKHGTVKTNVLSHTVAAVVGFHF